MTPELTQMLDGPVAARFGRPSHGDAPIHLFHDAELGWHWNAADDMPSDGLCDFEIAKASQKASNTSRSLLARTSRSEAGHSPKTT